jgi:aminopeptidase YwaD
MKYNKTILLFAMLICLINNYAFAQLDSIKIKPLLKKHISTLASDEYGGREPGTKGEMLSSIYIIKEFTEIGLTAKGERGYLQPFTFTKSLKPGTKSALTINGKSMEAISTYYPLAYSANASANGKAVRVGFGISAPSLNHNDYDRTDALKGKIFVIDASTPDKGGPHSKFAEFADLRTRIDLAIAKGAAGIVFYTSDSDLKEPSLDSKIKVNPCTIPVIYLVRSQKEMLLIDQEFEINMTSEIIKDEATGNNVLGYIDNKAEYTIVIGAHYDHLGHGGDESLYRGEPAIHNGADDNASGVAGVIELARYFKANGPKSNNYLFIAFSGEEKGLLGSGHYAKNPSIDLTKVNYMLNMDMIGRLKPEDPTLIVSGVGTSDAWKITMNYINQNNFKVKTTESGIGPSDHTSFYLKNIPVLHFFSGTHNDYHKPSDDENLINYKGEFDILNYMITLIEKLDDKGKISFIKTKEENSEESPRFKVTLGVVPDYAFEGAGMRIDGVSDGKPAAKAGLKSGDIVISIGDFKVQDMMSYMKALGKFEKGQKATVGILRGKEELKIDVTF